MMTRNGVYPYDYMNSYEKFNDTSLPSKDDFYSILNDERVSDEAYEHAKTVWDVFNLRSMGENHDLYLKSDVLLLADVFENFRKTCKQYYKLDPSHTIDTDSLLYEIETEDVYKDLYKDKDLFDNSNYPVDSPFYFKENKKVIEKGRSSWMPNHRIYWSSIKNVQLHKRRWWWR